ncbi:GSCOCG00013351001-RA-CDS [Cotesia congregata]|uniref:Similar to Myrosinase 1 (Brevicoryne brassicae) n=1 Tax=Cotesia congregata TaxID=51543 RepID=A0A8J2HKA0_COTCN|nr:GSCOCG00013351001-RA-CDS [Cotesia congregata]CAG5093951.1 Similar to Myrosinase 1 (Brevicoryne brassicae) [Cotesia congregata]
MWVLGNVSLLLGLMDSLTSMLPDFADMDYYATSKSLVGIQRVNAAKEGRFPDDFLFGVSTSAYQTEGAWNVSGKGESIWDYATHNSPETVIDNSNGDIAANSYFMYKTDIDLAKQLGCNAFRISISWPRILPTGFPNSLNPKGIEHYNNVINEMLGRNITPVVTLFHWDLPKELQDLGGWTNPLIVDWFVDYARIVFKAFGDRVKYWSTVNEPTVYCVYGYGGKMVPFVNHTGITDYLCGHHMLLAHAKAHKMYNEEFRQEQKGKVGLSISVPWAVASNPEDPEEVAGADRWFEFWGSWFLNPLFGHFGDYPEKMKSRIAENSLKQGFPRSRLPEFTAEEISMLRNSTDFLGLNYYHASPVQKYQNYNVTSTVSFFGDIEMLEVPANQNGAAFSDRSTSWALVSTIQKINKDFEVPMIMITENGYWDRGQLADIGRAKYHHEHLSELPGLIAQGINIRGYFAWSLIDNFEWSVGYTQKFGLFSVDYTVPERTRIPKISTKVISDFYKTKKIPLFLWSLNEVEFDINVGL